MHERPLRPDKEGIGRYGAIVAPFWKRRLAPVLIFAIAACAPVLAGNESETSDTLRVLGYASMQPLGDDGNPREVAYRYWWDSDKHQGTLELETVIAADEQDVFRYTPEVGQEFITAIYPMRFGDKGEFICVETNRGAVSQGLQIYALSRDNTFARVFAEAGRFGYRIIDVTGDGVPDIVGGYGDVHGRESEMRGYTWDGEEFSLSRTIQVKTPHSYEIRRE